MNHLTTEEKGRLIEELKAGNKEAFKEIYAAYCSHIYYLCLKITGNSKDAEDISQETFIYVYKNIRRLRSAEAFSSWIQTIAVRMCWKVNKKNSREAGWNMGGGSDEPQVDEKLREPVLPEEVLIKKELREDIIAAIDSLPPKQRDAVYMYYYGEMSVEQIAKMQKCKKGTVCATLFKARGALKEKLKQIQHSTMAVLGPVSIKLLLEAASAAQTMNPAKAEQIYSGIENAIGTASLHALALQCGKWSVRQAAVRTAAVAAAGAVAVGVYSAVNAPKPVQPVVIETPAVPLAVEPAETESAAETIKIEETSAPETETAAAEETTAVYIAQTLAEMIGEEDAETLIDMVSQPDYSRAQELVELVNRNGLTVKAEAYGQNDTYYTLLELVRYGRKLRVGLYDAPNEMVMRVVYELVWDTTEDMELSALPDWIGH